MTNANVMKTETFSLSEREMRIIRDEDARRGISNLSATARLIINEWLELKHSPTPGNGNQSDGEEK